MAKLLLALILIIPAAFAQERNVEEIAESILGEKKTEKFSFHMPSYFIFGEDDLKIQVSFKYRLAQAIPLYFAYTELLFWKVYDESKPFLDINYRPEIFYRIIEQPGHSLKGLDMGYLHTSNGKDKEATRSLDRVFLRANYFTKISNNSVAASLMVYHIYNNDATNEDVVNYLGYWDLQLYFANLLTHEKQGLDLELRTFAGSKVINVDSGGYQIGLNYNLGSEN